jgi:hypothetical protein
MVLLVLFIFWDYTDWKNDYTDFISLETPIFACDYIIDFCRTDSFVFRTSGLFVPIAIGIRTYINIQQFGGMLCFRTGCLHWFDCAFIGLLAPFLMQGDKLRIDTQALNLFYFLS